jgi:predicted O-methyltransferase YrrM
MLINGKNLLPHYDCTIGQQQLYDHIVAAKPNVCYELGTREGCSTRAILLGLFENEKNYYHGRLVSIDIDDCSNALDGFEYLKPLWYFHKAEATQFYLDELQDEAPFIDFMFIDTNHSYDETITWLTTWVTKVKIGGYILWHDTNNKGEGNALYNWGVKQALDELIGNNQNWTLEYNKEESGMAYIRRIA